jgi:hypothetical protein
MNVLDRAEELREARAKEVDDAHDAVSKILQLPAWDVKIAEGYIQGNIYLHIHLGVGPVEPRPVTQHFCTVFYNTDWLVDLADDPAFATDLRRLFRNPNVRTVHETVFVCVRQGVKDTKAVPAGVRSVVWLQDLDSGECLVADTAQRRAFPGQEGSFNLPFKLRPAVVEGELIPLAGDISTSPDDLPDEVVKGRPEVVHDIPDDGSPQQRHRPVYMDSDRVPAGLLVNLDSEAVKLAVSESADFFLKGLEVEVCPVDLRSNASERVLRVNLGHEVPSSHGQGQAEARGTHAADAAGS